MTPKEIAHGIIDAGGCCPTPKGDTVSCRTCPATNATSWGGCGSDDRDEDRQRRVEVCRKFLKLPGEDKPKKNPRPTLRQLYKMAVISSGRFEGGNSDEVACWVGRVADSLLQEDKE